LTFKNRGPAKNVAGWNTANTTFWQCTAAEIENYTPAPDAKNIAYGCWAQFSGDGEWGQSNNHVQPRSLFYSQLADRIGSNVADTQSRILPRNTNATSSPTVEAAMELAKEAYTPRLTLQQWIIDAPFTASVSPDGVRNVDDIQVKAVAQKTKGHEYDVADGHILMDGAVMTGGRHEVPWWNGKTRYNYLPKAKPHVTRFVPGREGLGLTDRVDSVVAFMVDNDITVLDHNYGLWYERRRDDHERIRRRDGDVWAPFYEQPFARSGEGTAWDGLSKYDLTRPNAWYWSRLGEFADKGAEAGRLLFNEHYFQHNILEAGAHWVDSPWRSTNNINSTDMPEPVPFAGDKRIFVADMFYDVNHPVRRELHKNFIRMNLDNFADDPNVVHLISAEFTGPQKFVEFWLDEIDAWQKETGKDANIALSTTKDVQDAILANPKYAPLIDIIDIRYWHYNTDGVYAPEGGKNLAPRQHARKMKVGQVKFDEAYKSVSEYRTKYPDKAVTYYALNYPAVGWGVFMAGGSLANIPVKDADFLSAAAKMKIVPTDKAGVKILGDSDNCIIYSTGINDIDLPLEAGKYRVTAYNPSTGESSVVNKSLRVKADVPFTTADSTKVYFFKKL
ncbi:MAG: pectate lyase, partial [Duncaniella sp.]|nr:pectate lyase [Duncaniella sp.]